MTGMQHIVRMPVHSSALRPLRSASLQLLVCYLARLSTSANASDADCPMIGPRSGRKGESDDVN